MNWKQIQKKHPKALSKYINNLYKDESKTYEDFIGFVEGEHCYNEDFKWRDLYDFFDELNISIGIVPVCTYKDDTVNKITDFDWHIIVVGKEYAIEDDPPICYKNRKEAESAAFTKAFEVLENRVKNDISQR